MGFTDFFIRRPVFATVLSLLILMVGAVSFFKLPVRQFPNISPSVVTVNVIYPGASASLMEGFVTTPLEAALAGVDGLDYMKSSSRQNSSSVSLHFRLGYDINLAVADVGDKVNAVRGTLPNDIEDPVIEKQDPNINPTLFIAFESDTLSGEAITDYLIRSVQPQLEIQPGVAQAEILGKREYAMRIWLNPQKMTAFNISPAEVEQGLLTNNLQAPTGSIETPLQEFAVDAETDLKTAEQFNNLVLKQGNNYLVKLGDIADAKLGPANSKSSIVVDGKKAIVIGVIPNSTANPLDVSRATLKALENIKAQMPNGITAKVVWDNSKFIAESVREVERTIIEASIFVILVMFLFLGSFRILSVPMLTIPLSLIGVCSLMLASGFTINTLTLLAMVLGIGMVVDDAIVVSENIHRHIEMGKTPFQAALDGAREIKFAVIAMTLTLAAVYAPIGFMTDITGALFREFAFTLAGAVIISGFIALTLSPMMCSKVMAERKEEGRLEKAINKISEKIMYAYEKTLRAALTKRPIIIGLIIAIFVGCYFLFMFTPKELAPKEDTGAILTIVTGPSSANLDYTKRYTQQLEEIFKAEPNKEGYGIINGYPRGINSAMAFLVLSPWNERPGINTLVASMYPKLAGITGVNAFALNPYSLPGAGSHKPVVFVLQTTGSYEELNQTMNKLVAKVQQQGGLVNVDSDLKLEKPEINLNIDRERAGSLGISMREIGSALNLSLGEPTRGKFNIRGRGYDVIPQLDARFRNTPDKLFDISVRAGNGQLVPLSNVIGIQNKVIPKDLNHFQQMRSATLSAVNLPFLPLDKALDFMTKTAKEILPDNTQFTFSGTSRQYIEASGAIVGTFIFAIVFIFLVLAAQFESFRDPLIVMFSVPLSTAGAMLALMATHGSMNIYTEIGLVTLIGLISKHGIMMVEFANQLQQQGEDIQEAIIKSASVRLRPILMTTVAMILGVIPLALATGAGAVSRSQIGWVIIGGMALGTLLSMYVVPTMYTYLASKKRNN